VEVVLADLLLLENGLADLIVLKNDNIWRFGCRPFVDSRIIKECIVTTEITTEIFRRINGTLY
jgi:hypothetical protein